MRYLLVVAGVLVFIAGLQLFVFSEETARYFAWTIDPPLTAAFLGAGYWASVALEWLATREATWARARVAVPAVFTFTTLTLVATLLHLDRFHLGDPSFVTEAATWGWIGIYVLVPPAMAVLWALQVRAPGSDGARTAPVPAPVRLVLAVHALVFLPVGAVLFVAPERTASLWPWLLTPLTARAVAGWLLGIGVAAAHVLRENDVARARPAFYAYVALGVLQLVALARYSSDVEWGSPSAWVFVTIVASMLVTGTLSLRASGDSRPPPQA
jgi:hypothetical protein